jgi:hypothetical protein
MFTGMESNRSKFYLGVILTAVLIILLISRGNPGNAASTEPPATPMPPATTGLAMIGIWKNASTTLKIQVGGDIYESFLLNTGFYAYAGLFHVIDRTHIRIAPFTSNAPIQGIYEVEIDENQLTLVDQNGNTISLNRAAQNPPGGMSNFN